VIQLCRRPNLAVEALDDVGPQETIFLDDLQRNKALELPVAGLEDGAHAALAELVEQDVGAQQQPVTTAEKQFVNLIRRQPAALHQFRRDRLRLTGVRTVIELLRGEQTVLSQSVEKGFGRHADHDTAPPGTTPARTMTASRKDVCRSCKNRFCK